MIHVTYDLSGIQRFIFQVPRLRSIVGGSTLIDRFDRELVYGIGDTVDGIELQFAGGGHGHFVCDNANVADQLVHELIRLAHRDGIGVKIGRSENVETAINSASENFPYLPKDLDGEPCAESGLSPVPPQAGSGADRDVHSVVWRRVRDRDGKVSDRLQNWALEELRGSEYEGLPSELVDQELLFLSDVSSNVHSDSDDGHAGRLGCAALGNRNRWAIVAMDGNDVGSQFRAISPDDLKGRSSRAAAIDKIGCGSFLQASSELLRDWAKRFPDQVRAATHCAPDGAKTTVLPIRPLILGGDDIVVLCHPALAMQFAHNVMRAFEERSQEFSEFWESTGGRLTISAGVLFAPTGYPLHTAIPYAESLLGSAKGYGRSGQEEGEPLKSCLDWESITEGLLDTPTARRRRDLQFRDEDSEGRDEIILTSRPCTVAQLEKLFEICKTFEQEEIPSTILHGIHSGLHQGYYGRLAYRARLAKNHPRLEAMLNEDGPGSHWNVEKTKNGRRLRLDVLDAVSLWKEESRMRKETVR